MSDVLVEFVMMLLELEETEMAMPSVAVALMLERVLLELESRPMAVPLVAVAVRLERVLNLELEKR